MFCIFRSWEKKIITSSSRTPVYPWRDIFRQFHSNRVLYIKLLWWSCLLLTSLSNFGSSWIFCLMISMYKNPMEFVHSMYILFRTILDIVSTLIFCGKSFYLAEISNTFCYEIQCALIFNLEGNNHPNYLPNILQCWTSLKFQYICKSENYFSLEIAGIDN